MRRLDARFARRAVLVGWAATLPWAWSSIVATRNMQRAHTSAVAHVTHTEIGMGRWIATLPPDAVVASFDIGGIGFASGRRIVDIGGLGDADTADRLRRGTMWELLAARGVTHVILPGATESAHIGDGLDLAERLHFADNAAVRLEQLHTITTPTAEWLPGVRGTWNAAQRQNAHRVLYTNLPGPKLGNAPPSARRAIDDQSGRISSADRAVVERMLGVLEASGFPVDMHVVDRPPRVGNPSSSCNVFLGRFGVALSGCGEVANLDVRAYLGARDWGGAARVVAHALVRARRANDPAFHPILAPTLPPAIDGERSASAASASWGIAVALAIFFTGSWALLMTVGPLSSRLGNMLTSWTRMVRRPAPTPP